MKPDGFVVLILVDTDFDWHGHFDGICEQTFGRYIVDQSMALMTRGSKCNGMARSEVEGTAFHPYYSNSIHSF